MPCICSLNSKGYLTSSLVLKTLYSRRKEKRLGRLKKRQDREEPMKQDRNKFNLP